MCSSKRRRSRCSSTKRRGRRSSRRHSSRRLQNRVDAARAAAQLRALLVSVATERLQPASRCRRRSGVQRAQRRQQRRLRGRCGLPSRGMGLAAAQPVTRGRLRMQQGLEEVERVLWMLPTLWLEQRRKQKQQRRKKVQGVPAEAQAAGAEE